MSNMGEKGAVGLHCTQLANNAKTITLDWLEINLSGVILSKNGELKKSDELEYGEVIELSSDIYLQADGQTARHKFKFLVFYYGVHFGTLTAVPKSKVINEKIIVLQVENSQFYLKDWLDAVLEIIEAGGWLYHSVSQCHIAHDSQKNKKVLDFVSEYHYSKGEKYVHLGKVDSRSNARLLPFIDTKTHTVSSFYWGRSKTWKKHLYAYNKSWMLRQKSDKPYILEYFQRNGMFDPARDVYRVELRLKLQEIKKYKAFEFGALDQPEFLSNLYQAGIRNWFEFVPVEGRKEKNKRPRVKIMDFSGWEFEYLERTTPVPKSSLQTIKTSIRKFYEHWLIYRHDSLIESVRFMVALHKLEDFYHEKREFWYKDLKKKMPGIRPIESSENIKQMKLQEIKYVA